MRVRSTASAQTMPDLILLIEYCVLTSLADLLRFFGASMAQWSELGHQITPALQSHPVRSQSSLLLNSHKVAVDNQGSHT